MTYEIKILEDKPKNFPNLVTFAPRRGFESEFIEKNPILRKDELVIIFDDILKSGVIDTSMMDAYTMYKRGDGITPFIDLPYIGAFQAISGGLLYCANAQLPSAKIDLAYNLFKDLEGI